MRLKSILLLTIFISFLATPAFLVICNETDSITQPFSFNEEENKDTSENEIDKEVEVKLLFSENVEIISKIDVNKYWVFKGNTFNTYTKVTSPPPELRS